MSERFEPPTYPPCTPTRTEEGAMAEADVLREKIRGGEASTYAEAEQLLTREEFQKKLEQRAKDRDQLRPKWKKWLDVSRTDPKEIAMEQAIREGEWINSLLASGVVKSPSEVTEYLHKLGSSIVNSPEDQILEQREILREGKLLGGGIGGAKFVELKGGVGAVFKPHNTYEKKMRTEFIHKERAAYLVDRFLGFNFVPPTLVRELNGETGSLQKYVTDAKTSFEVERDDVPKEEWMKLALFDSLILNLDRYGGENYLIKDKKIYAIDHGGVLPFESGLDGTYHLNRIDETSVIPTELRMGFERFARWTEGQELLREAFAELFGEKRATAFLKRVQIFLTAIDEQGHFLKETFRKSLEASRAELCPT